jgi:hypothetical protein
MSGNPNGFPVSKPSGTYSNAWNKTIRSGANHDGATFQGIGNGGKAGKITSFGTAGVKNKSEAAWARMKNGGRP